jgi:hypothetical protein
MPRLLDYPSFYSLAITGILMVIIVFTTITHFKQIQYLDYFKKITILSAIGILVGTHGLLHALYEPTDTKPQLLVEQYFKPIKN